LLGAFIGSCAKEFYSTRFEVVFNQIIAELKSIGEDINGIYVALDKR